MMPSFMPTRASVRVLLAMTLLAALALLAGVSLDEVTWAVGAALSIGLMLAVLEVLLNRAAGVTLELDRTTPQALALGVGHVFSLTLSNSSGRLRKVQVFDDTDPSLAVEGMPQSVVIAPRSALTLQYTVTPRVRGDVRLGPAFVRVRGRLGVLEFLSRSGPSQSLRVYPNFAAVARYAWLAHDRRLSQIGIKSFTQRGAGTDFKQLSEYRAGDPIRHIDWRASLRCGRPVVREYQDERDQCVLFALDCGRRMRADEGAGQEGSHFDQALNALMLLSYVALKEGDEVGVLTFGTPPGAGRHFAPRKGRASLDGLMAHFYDLQPSATHSDYMDLARQVMQHQRKRALVIVLTNFRDEAADELEPALRLMRERHVVMVASLRERVLRELAEADMTQPENMLDIASALWFEQSRRDAFGAAIGRDVLSIDTEPQHLAVTLVNRYHAVKKSGLL